MHLRPYYKGHSKWSQSSDVTDLVQLLLLVANTPASKKILQRLNIRLLLLILRGISKDEENDTFYEFDVLDEKIKNLWLDVLDVLNNFPCVKLIDAYSPYHLGSSGLNKSNSDLQILHGNNGSIGNYDNNNGNSTPINYNLNNNGNGNGNGNHNNRKQISKNGFFNENTVEASTWYDLAIDSEDYDFLLEYLFDIEDEKYGIIFPLIEVGTKKFNKIYEVLNDFCHHIKISNDHLSVIKDSEKFMNKLSVLTLENYEYSEVAEKLSYQTLNVLGNEVDLFTISAILEFNKDLETIYFKGRLRDYIPANINPKIKVYYDLVVFDTIDRVQIQKLGNIERINKLYLNFTLETDISLEWLKLCQNLKFIHFGLNLKSSSSTQTFTLLNKFPNLEELYIKYCNLRLSSKNQKVSDYNLFPKLKYLTLAYCQTESTFLHTISNSPLIELYLDNCKIKYNSFVKLPKYLKLFSVSNKDKEEFNDLIFLSHKARSSSGIPSLKCILLNFDGKLVNLTSPSMNDVYFADNKQKDKLELNLTYNKPSSRHSLFTFMVYPTSQNTDFSFLKNIANKYHVKKVIIELYTYSKEFFEAINIDNIKNVKVYKYNVYAMYNYMNELLAKPSLTPKEQSFFLSGHYRQKEKPETDSKKDKLANSLITLLLPREASTSKNTHSNHHTKNGRVSKETYQYPNDSRICDICFKSFTRAASLTRHLLNHHNIVKDNTCHLCGRTFKRSDHLKTHFRSCSKKN